MPSKALWAMVERSTVSVAVYGPEEELFIAFGDRTNANETYGGGRHLWTSLPDETGRLFIDFNRALNPSCAFTEFAICPLPPRQNQLPVRIEAGEKTYRKKG